MTLIRWAPSRELSPFHSEVTRLFTGIFSDATTGEPAARRWLPATDLVETDGHYVLRADLPGVAEEDVSVEIDGDVLTVTGERRSEHEGERDGARHLERAYGRFSRRLTLPEGVDAESVAATFERGVLEVRVPKPAQREPRRVTIDVAGAQPAVEGGEAATAPAGSD